MVRGSGSPRGSPQRSGPAHLRTLAPLFGRQHRFRFRISPPDGLREPWRSTEAGYSCQPASKGCRCATLPLPLVCLSRDWQGWGPEGAYAQAHEFPSKIRSQVRVTSVEGYGQLGGRDRWPTFGLPPAPLPGSHRQPPVVVELAAPVWGKPSRTTA